MAKRLTEPEVSDFAGEVGQRTSMIVTVAGRYRLTRGSAASVVDGLVSRTARSFRA